METWDRFTPEAKAEHCQRVPRYEGNVRKQEDLGNLVSAGQKTSAAFSAIGSVITKKLQDVKKTPHLSSHWKKRLKTKKSKVGGTKPAGSDFGELQMLELTPQSHLWNRRRRA